MRSWFLRLIEILVVGKGLVLFGKGFVVFITSSTAIYLGRNITNMHTTKYGERYSIALPYFDWVFFYGMKKNDCFLK